MPTNRNNYKKSVELYITNTGQPITGTMVKSINDDVPLPVNSPITSPPPPTPGSKYKSPNEILGSNSKTETNKNLDNSSTQIEYQTLDYANTGNPEVWGPAMWFSLHNGAARYPNNPSPIWRERMKSFIQGLPVMLPCQDCSDHANAFIESRIKFIDNIVGNKQNLFTFFWEFHNSVNKRLGKRIVSFQEAYNIYHDNVNVSKLQIK